MESYNCRLQVHTLNVKNLHGTYLITENFKKVRYYKNLLFTLKIKIYFVSAVLVWINVVRTKELLNICLLQAFCKYCTQVYQNLTCMQVILILFQPYEACEIEEASLRSRASVRKVSPHVLYCFFEGINNRLKEQRRHLQYTTAVGAARLFFFFFLAYTFASLFSAIRMLPLNVPPTQKGMYLFLIVFV